MLKNVHHNYVLMKYAAKTYVESPKRYTGYVDILPCLKGKGFP